MNIRKPAKPFFIHISSKEKTIFFSRLAMYLRAGISLPVALSYIEEASKSTSLKYVLRTISDIVLRGEPLSKGMREFPKQFDFLIRGFVEAGESSGRLAQTLTHLSATIQKKNVLRAKLFATLLYPFIVMVSTISLTVFLVVYIFPKIVPILRSLHTKLSVPTRFLLYLSSLKPIVWLYIGSGLFLLIPTLCILLVIPRSKRVFERFVLYIPIISALFRSYVLANSFSIIAVQLEGNIGLLSALQTIEQSVAALVYRDTFVIIQLRVAEGQRLSATIREFPALFPSVVVQLISAGEMTGTLQESVSALAENYEQELDDLTQTLSSLLEPILMIVLGTIVGFVALAIITPIYGLTQNLSPM